MIKIKWKDGIQMRSKKPSKKSSAKKRKTLVRKLDTLVSKLVRKRDKYCVQCGTTYRLTAGHIFSRRSYSTRWDLENVFAQCWSHNFQHGFDNYDYYKWYQDKFGVEKFDELRFKFKSSVKYHLADLEELNEELDIIYNNIEED